MVAWAVLFNFSAFTNAEDADADSNASFVDDGLEDGELKVNVMTALEFALCAQLVTRYGGLVIYLLID